MAADGIGPAQLKVDGGMAQNGFFLQRLADVLAVPILRPKMAESTAFGAACLAGLGHGIYQSLDEIAGLWESDVRCEPKLDSAARVREMEGWRQALKRVRLRSRPSGPSAPDGVRGGLQAWDPVSGREQRFN